MQTQLTGLTSLRFIAALMVVFHHVMDFSLSPIHPEIIQRGGLAVDLFFVLSGYILTHVYGDAFRNDLSAAYAFLSARLARLYPVHLFVLTVFAALVIASALTGHQINTERYSVSGLLSHLALVDAWGIGPARMTWNYPAWSISAEWAAYLAFPVLTYVTSKARPSWQFVVVAMAWIVCCGPFHLARRTVDFSVVRILPEFLMGMLAYRLLPPTKKVLFANIQIVALSIVIFVAISLSIPDAWITLAFVYLIVLIPSADRLAGSILTNRHLISLGEESYSLYMVHVLIFGLFYGALRSFRHVWAPQMFDVIAILLAIGAAKLLYHYVEVPGRTYVRDALAFREWRAL
jgi:peptidoglycan/LPS O-acetylase OafA/YrhL